MVKLTRTNELMDLIVMIEKVNVDCC
jgi:hypothetical protein